MSTAATRELAKHLEHWLRLADDLRRLRCHTCEVWVMLPSAVPSTSNVQAPRRDPKPNEQCPRHPGEFEHTCRCCASEQLEHERASQVGTGRPPTPEYLAAKAQLAARLQETR